MRYHRNQASALGRLPKPPTAEPHADRPISPCPRMRIPCCPDVPPARFGKFLFGYVVSEREHQILIGRRPHNAAFGAVGTFKESVQTVDGFTHRTQHRRIERNIGSPRNVFGNQAFGLAR